MRTNVSSVRNEVMGSAGLVDAANGLALVRVTIGAMFVWVFFENLGKGTYTPAGYAGVINYYIKASHSPEVWKAVMGLMATHAAIAAPIQAITEISLGVLLVIGLLSRPAAFVAFLFRGKNGGPCHPGTAPRIWTGLPDGAGGSKFPRHSGVPRW